MGGWDVVRVSDVDFEEVRKEVIKKHRWSTHVVVVAMGANLEDYVGYNVKGRDEPGAIFRKTGGMKVVSEGKYKFDGTSFRLLIRNTGEAYRLKRKREASDEICVRMDKLYQSQLFTDATVHCGDQTFPVHRAVLSAGSP